MRATSCKDYDDAPRNSLDLLALNRFADPQKLQVAIKKACEYKADPKQYSSYEPRVRLRWLSGAAMPFGHEGFMEVAAVHALLDVGAPVDRQALSALQLISDRGCRQVIEDVALWVLVQSGNVKAATAELAMELREALIDQRGPDEETVSELVNLGANVQAKNVDLDSYVEDEVVQQRSASALASEPCQQSIPNSRLTWRNARARCRTDFNLGSEAQSPTAAVARGSSRAHLEERVRLRAELPE
ncbi:hypothetical protein AK812_SmicGene30276 [Symbiodinium microadriaticum]|uniref:Uncharacterized protein n=1 Tax=Symbiodinium microadriaticum TaxID=2951 RepID=A0A1Q9CZR4_SYMMI|nr:hypothetical protein AK812_SmicGene30276 [Symbiodinium microadriaticum]